MPVTETCEANADISHGDIENLCTNKQTSAQTKTGLTVAVAVAVTDALLSRPSRD